VADLQGNRILCYSDPQKDSFGLVREVHRADAIAPLSLPDCTLKAGILLP
jgi:hypothetical protein